MASFAFFPRIPRSTHLARFAGSFAALWLLQAHSVGAEESAFEPAIVPPAFFLAAAGDDDPESLGELPSRGAVAAAAPAVHLDLGYGAFDVVAVDEGALDVFDASASSSIDTVDFSSSDTVPILSARDPVSTASESAETVTSAFDAAFGTRAPCVFCAAYFGLLKSDVKHVFTSPVRWDSAAWRDVGIKASLLLGTIAFIDGRASDYVDSHKSDDSDKHADAFGPFGEQYAAYVIGGFLLAGKLAHHEKAKAVAVDGLTTSLIAAGLIVPTLKEITGRSRPREGQGPHDFHPFSGGDSFPSGHSAAAFSVAASVAEHYDQIWVKSLSYGIASLVDYSRMEKDAHFLSDVAAGAMIGVGVAHSIHRFNEKHASVTVLPTLDPRGGGIDGFVVGIEVGLR